MASTEEGMSDMRSWGPVEWMSAWKQSKDSWQVPTAEQYAISTCTIGAKIEPAISFPRMAEWLLQRKPWERVRNNSNILVKWEESTSAHIEGFLFWNPKKLTRGAQKQQQQQEQEQEHEQEQEQEQQQQEQEHEQEQEQEQEQEWQKSPAGQDAHQALPNYFYNSVTIYVNLGADRKKINLKYFLNGSMTLTGCTGMQDAKDAVAIWQNMLQSRPEWWENPESIFRVTQEFKFNMMNAYFSMGFSVDCLKVYEFCRDELGLFVDYDPKQYQGVIIYYMWNRNQEEHNGICACPGEYSCPFSAKRRRGEKDGDCIKLTFIVFSTGKVLITGGISPEQITDCYKFFTGKFRQFAKRIVQFSLKDFMEQNLAKIQPPKEKRRGKRRSPAKVEQEQEVRLTAFWPQTETD